MAAMFDLPILFSILDIMVSVKSDYRSPNTAPPITACQADNKKAPIKGLWAAITAGQGISQ